MITNKLMDEDKAKKILKDEIKEDGSLNGLGVYIGYEFGSDDVVLDGTFNIEYLEAVVWWMKKHKL